MSGWFANIDWAEIGRATLETLAMLGGSLVLTILIGLPLGVVLFLTGPGQVWASRIGNGVVALIVNLLRSVPFIILLIVMIPVTVLLVGTSLGVTGAIPPLVVGAAPFFARLVETALREVDRNTVEAVQAMGATTRDLVLRALLPEAVPGIVAGATVTAVALVSFTAMAGVVGAGGLGDLAIRFGYQRFQTDVMLVTVALLLVLVQGIQMLGDALVFQLQSGTQVMNRRSLLAAIALLPLAACGGSKSASDPNTLTVAATAVPHAEILAQVAPVLAKQGVTLDVKVFNDYVQPNTQVAEGRITVNYFQTEPYLASFNAARGTKLVTIAGIHVEPFGAYSRKWKRIGDLPVGATVAIPNEPSNSGRALRLLATAGIITLKNPDDPSATPRDIVANPKKLQFRELEAATLPRVLGEVDLALINTNYALDAKLNPTRDALLIEGKDSPYVNYVVGLAAAKTDPRVQKLVAALRSPETKAFIARKYGGAVLPAF